MTDGKEIRIPCLSKILELAKRPNVVIKVSPSCTLSLGPAGTRV